MLKELDNCVKLVTHKYIVNMKVYIYVNQKEVVMLSGLLSNNALVTGDDFTIAYYNQPTTNTVMVSLDVDQFVYLEDQGVLVTTELLFN